MCFLLAFDMMASFIFAFPLEPSAVGACVRADRGHCACYGRSPDSFPSDLREIRFHVRGAFVANGFCLRIVQAPFPLVAGLERQACSQVFLGAAHGS